MIFNGNYVNRPQVGYEDGLSQEYLVEDIGLLSDNKTRIEQMMLAGQNLAEMSKFYTYDQSQIERDENGNITNFDQFEDLAIPYGTDKLEMSEKLKEWSLGMQQRVKDQQQRVKEQQQQSSKAAASQPAAENPAPSLLDVNRRSDTPPQLEKGAESVKKE